MNRIFKAQFCAKLSLQHSSENSIRQSNKFLQHSILKSTLNAKTKFYAKQLIHQNHSSYPISQITNKHIYIHAHT